ncbi:MAG: DMT family transporter [Proteobacteria bacterium]|nr:DMT family transporter [Pseudomonadota bacterium]
MKHYLSIIMAAIIFGSSGVFIKTLDLPVSTITFFRMAVPFALMSLVFLFRKKTFPSINDKPMVLASCLNAIRLFFYFAGYAYGNISTTVILLYTWPVFATFWSCLFLGETLSLYRLGLFVTTFSGVALITLNQTLSLTNQKFIGAVFILLSAFIYSMTIVIFKKKSLRYDPLETLWFQNCIGSFAFFPFVVINRPFPLVWQSGLAVTYAFLIGVVGFGLFFSGLQKIDASRASFLTYVEVVSGIIFGVVFFNETLSWNIIAGGSLVLLSALALSRKG